MKRENATNIRTKHDKHYNKVAKIFRENIYKKGKRDKHYDQNIDPCSFWSQTGNHGDQIM
jgi:hypothetical protein